MGRQEAQRGEATAVVAGGGMGEVGREGEGEAGRE